LFFPVALLLGCSGGLTGVTGKVTHNGEPVKNGTIFFYPIAEGATDKRLPASGAVEGGSFTLETQAGAKDGAAPGRYRVAYTAPIGETPPGVELKEGESVPPSPYAGLAVKPAEVEVKGASTPLTLELVPAPPAQ